MSILGLQSELDLFWILGPFYPRGSKMTREFRGHSYSSARKKNSWRETGKHKKSGLVFSNGDPEFYARMFWLSRSFTRNPWPLSSFIFFFLNVKRDEWGRKEFGGIWVLRRYPICFLSEWSETKRKWERPFLHSLFVNWEKVEELQTLPILSIRKDWRRQEKWKLWGGPTSFVFPEIGH